MKRNKLRILLLLLLVSITIIFVFFLVGSFVAGPDFPYLFKNFVVDPPPDPLGSDLTHAFTKYESGELTHVDMAAITTFDWDRLYIYVAYASPYDELKSQFGWWSSWSCSTNISWSDGISLLVFVGENTIVHCMDYGSFTGGYDFSKLASGHPDAISSQDALFILRGDNWKYVDLLNNK